MTAMLRSAALIAARFDHGGQGDEPGQPIGGVTSVEPGQGTKVNLTCPLIVFVSPSSDPPSGLARVVTRT